MVLKLHDMVKFNCKMELIGFDAGDVFSTLESDDSPPKYERVFFMVDIRCLKLQEYYLNKFCS